MIKCNIKVVLLQYPVHWTSLTYSICTFTVAIEKIYRTNLNK